MTNRPINADRRTSRSLQEWAIIFSLLVNFGGLVWFAASMNSALIQLQVTQTRQNLVLDKLTDRISINTVDIAVLKAALTKEPPKP